MAVLLMIDADFPHFALILVEHWHLLPAHQAQIILAKNLDHIQSIHALAAASPSLSPWPATSPQHPAQSHRDLLTTISIIHHNIPSSTACLLLI
jgi:hypothetical protein